VRAVNWRNMPKPIKKKTGIRYLYRNRVPADKHYPVTEKPLFSKRVREPKYHTVVRISGLEYDYSKNKWVRGTRYVTLAHNDKMTRGEIEQQAELICQNTSEQFQIRKSTLVEGRRNPIYEEVSS